MTNHKKGSDLIIFAAVLIVLVFSLWIYFYSQSRHTTVQVSSLTIDQLKSAQIPNFPSGKNENITLVNGEHKEVIKAGDLSFNTWIKLNTEATSYTSTDVTGDGAEDMIATVVWSGGGTGKFAYLTVFKNTNGTPEYVTSQALGDRIKINKISMEGNVIVADITGSGHQVLKFKLVNNKLVEVKK